MASINKLSVRGVRSFSPDDTEQVLEFYFPCTIIVGANGCGKTTIIESLKYAVSGAMPPGNKSGQAFVHDPRSIGQKTVKANVKLRFTGRTGNSMVVVRSMEVQQNKTTITFRQLDGVLRSTDEHGNRVSQSAKCGELDRQLPMLLGVSKAILEHVVFCHQEDSSWPLQEGAVLKKRFDDIFDSTRYSKALEVFAKLKKDYSAQVKDLKADVAGISSHRHAAKGFRQELSEHGEQMEQVEEEIAEQKEALKETDEEQKRLGEIQARLDEINSGLEACKLLQEKEKIKYKTCSQMLQEDLTQKHSVSELKEMQREFNAKLDHQHEEKEELEAELKNARDTLKQIQKKEADLRENLGRLELSKEQHTERLKTRYEKMVELGNTFALGDTFTQSQLSQTQNTSLDQSGLDQSMSLIHQEPILDISKKDLEDFFRAIDKKESELRQEVEDQKAKARTEDDQFAAKIADQKAKQLSIEDNRSKLTKKAEAARKELAAISDQINSSGLRIRKSDVEEERQRAAGLAKERDQLNSDPRKSEIALEIRDLETRVDVLKRELEDDRMALGYLRQTSDAQNAVVVLKGQCVKDLEILDETIRESTFLGQQFNIASFPKNLPGMEDKQGDELRAVVDKAVDEISSKFDSRNDDLQRARAQVAKLQQAVSERQALIGHQRRTVQTKWTRMGELEAPGGSVEAVKAVVEQLKAYELDIKHPTPDDVASEARPQELLAYLTSRLEELESDSMEGIGSDTIARLISRLVNESKVDAEKYECPCCTREFINASEYKTFKKQMKKLKSENSPLLQIDESKKAAISKYANWKDTVSQHSTAVLEYRRIANEVHDLEATIRELDAALADCSRQLTDGKDTASELEDETSSLRELLDSANRWSEAASRIAEKRMQIQQKAADLSVGTDGKGRDLETVEREMNARTEEREQYNNQMARLNKELTVLMNRITQVTEAASRVEENLREKEQKLAKEDELISRKKHFQDVILNCSAEEKQLQEQLAPVLQQLKKKEAEQRRNRQDNEDVERRLRTTLDLFLSSAKELRDIESEIKKYESSTNEDELANFEKKSAEFAKEKEVQNRRIQQITPKFENIVKALEDQERHRKNLEHNIEAITSTQRIAALKKEIQVLESQIAQVDGHETVDDDADSLRNRRQSVLEAIARLEGRRGEILECIRSVKRKLSAPEYKDVDEEYRVAMIKYETTQMAVKDLEKYHSALDKALLKFHSLKIAEINTIIRDLWTLTYKGRDISSIEIVSGQESGSRALRSYNYRVVMTKGSTQLDMRGRCSAGQRVLASIVIRLALAETFCLNFGCIALDEPTVNLDHDNKKGLAVALAQIIASRAHQSNFQLVLITHDEDFVSMMKSELASQSGFPMPEKYFQVRREEGADGKYYSKIDAVDWDELI